MIDPCLRHAKGYNQMMGRSSQVAPKARPKKYLSEGSSKTWVLSGTQSISKEYALGSVGFSAAHVFCRRHKNRRQHVLNTISIKKIVNSNSEQL